MLSGSEVSIRRVLIIKLLRVFFVFQMWHVLRLWACLRVLILKILLLKLMLGPFLFCDSQMQEWDRVESAQLERFYQQFAKKLLGTDSGFRV